MSPTAPPARRAGFFNVDVAVAVLLIGLVLDGGLTSAEDWGGVTGVVKTGEETAGVE